MFANVVFLKKNQSGFLDGWTNPRFTIERQKFDPQKNDCWRESRFKKRWIAHQIFWSIHLRMNYELKCWTVATLHFPFLFFFPFCFLFFSSSYWTCGLPADVQTRPVGNKNNRPHCAAQKSDMLSKHATGSAALLDIPSGAFHGERPSCRGNRPRVCILAARGVSVVTAGSLSSRGRLCCYGSAATRHLAPEQKLAPPVTFQKIPFR